jgi:polyhydroxyalkanoate synthase subunit PhaC
VTPPRSSKLAGPDRRLAPRPLPAHLASATMLWLTSRAALPVLKNALPLSSVAGERLRDLATKIAAHGFEPVERALDTEIARRAEAYVSGLEAYRSHPFRRRGGTAPVIWREGTTRLLDYGRHGDGSVVLVVPSLINRYYVLDLLPERSFLRHLASYGLRALVIDWGAPGDEEGRFDLTDYISGRLGAAFAAAARVAGEPIAVVGYCMGGLLALALALRHQPQVAGLALLATPWDFHAEGDRQARLVGLALDCVARLCGETGSVPVELIQTLFFILDPFAAERKFIRLAALDPAGDEARRFVALEDWINDGVPLAFEVARSCARSWYGENDPARGVWRVAGEPVRPQSFRPPALVVVPRRDRIVPPASAEPLAAALGTKTVVRPPLGHVGMMSALRAPDVLWTPVAQWLRARLGER